MLLTRGVGGQLIDVEGSRKFKMDKWTSDKSIFYAWLKAV